ncbi:hypothetical protein D3C78_1278270 [compost metagenome]
MVRIAQGTTFSGFSVSPAAMPISSVPENAKFTATMVIRIGKVPFGSQPEAVRLCRKGAGVPSFIGSRPNMAAPPRMINARMVTTLISENQNSLSAKKRVVTTLSRKIAAQKIKHHSHTGDCGNQYCMQKPAAVRLDPSATVQVSQYSQATV